MPSGSDDYDALVQLLEMAFSRRSSAEWLRLLEADDVPCSLVHSLPEVLALPQVEQLELFSEPVGSGLRYLRGPWRFTAPDPLSQVIPPSSANTPSRCSSGQSVRPRSSGCTKME